jgi:P4 family phage/plasmid primase-like protien
VTNVNSTDEKIQSGEPATGTTRLNELVEGLPKGLDRCLNLRTYSRENTASSPGSWDDAGPIKILSDAITATDYFARDLGDRLFRFSDGAYRQYAERYIRRKVKEHLEGWGRSNKWSSHLANEVCEYILADAPELWERPPLDEVNLANGILNLDTGDLREHDPRFLSTVQIPVVFDPTAECPAWDKFVEEVFPDDARELAFGLAADLMTPNRSAQQAVLFLGEGSNGKSTYLRALTSFIGSPNASGVSLHKLESDKFATSRIMGKLANICPDLPSTHLAETSVFKAITGGDDVHGEYKYRASFEFRPFCRLVFSANHVPRSSDASHAFFRRWVVVPFDRTFEPDEQIPRETLDARLSSPQELSGVLNKALQVLPRVRFQGFTQSQSMLEAWEEFKAMTDPLSVWLENHTIDDASAWVPKSALIRAFNKSAEDSGQAGLTKQAFGRAMRRARPHVGEAQRTVGDKQVKCYTGIGLRSGDDPDDHDDGGDDDPGLSQASTTATTNTTDYTIVTYPEVKASDSKEQIHRSNKYGNGSNGSKGSSVDQPPHEYVNTTDGVSRVISYLDALPTDTVVGLDLETTGLSPRNDKIRLAQIHAGDKTFVVDLFAVSDGRPIFEALGRAFVVVAHNAAFEYGFVLAKYGVALDALRDTYLLAKLGTAGDMRVDCSLAAVVERELGITLDKEPQTSDWSGKLTSRQIEYAARDARILLPLYESLTKKVAESSQHLVAEIEHAALPAVARMRLEGIPVDRQGWDEHAVDVVRRRDGLAEWMRAAEWMPDRDPTPQRWALQGPDCLAMLHAAGINAKGTTAKQLEPFTDQELVEALLSYRKAKGEEKDKARELVHQLAPAKAPMPAPPWNFGSTKQVLEIVSRILGFKPRDTSEATLLRYVEKHLFFRAQLRYRKLSKQASTYGSEWFKDAYDQQSGRLYPRWHQIGTSTGRFSCSSPNVQNIPLEGPYRSFFRAPKGRVFVDVDYSQIEVRIYAKMVGEKALLETFQRGGDVYTATAARLMKRPPSKVTKDQRQKAKAIMLGLLYGLSARGLPHYAFTNYGVEIPPKEAEDLISRFFRLYTNIAADHKRAADELADKGSVDRKTIIGRRRVGITVRNEAINAPIQGTAADGLKGAMGKVHEALGSVQDAFIVGAFHDELLIECNEQHGEEVKAIVEKAMIEAMDAIVNSTIPHVAITVEGAVVPAWTKD